MLRVWFVSGGAVGPSQSLDLSPTDKDKKVQRTVQPRKPTNLTQLHKYVRNIWRKFQ